MKRILKLSALGASSAFFYSEFLSEKPKYLKDTSLYSSCYRKLLELPYLTDWVHAFNKQAIKRQVCRSFDQNPPSLKSSFFGEDIDSILGLAACFDQSADCFPQLLELGFGFVEVGPSTLQREIYPEYSDLSISNNQVGIRKNSQSNWGILQAKSAFNSYRKRGSQKNKQIGICITPNINTRETVPYLSTNDLKLGVKHMVEVADFITVDISGPDTIGLSQFYEKDKLDHLIKRMQADRQREIGNLAICQNEQLKTDLALGDFFRYDTWDGQIVKFFIKINPEMSEGQLHHVLSTCEENKVDGIVISDFYECKVLSEDKDKHYYTNPQDNQRYNAICKKIKKQTKGNIPIISQGGINCGKDVIERVRSGASFVQFYDQMILQGPSFFEFLRTDLIAEMQKQGIKQISDVIQK